ncbi:MAG TPA: restriction endonuclease subunit S [Burkholderiales bacterium]|nr:restriction endonuclease subunit S [Burkholderiales bacterium]
MIDGLKPYPAMKDSGVPWLGEIPGHWETRPLKHWVRINRDVLPEATPPEYEFRYLDIGSVGTGVLTARPQRLRFAAAPSRARRIVSDGDTIVSTVRTYLNAVYFVEGNSDELVCSTGFAVLTPTAGTVPKFVSYLCQSRAFTDRVTADSVGIAYPAIAETRLAAFHVAVPSVTEQAAIVRFLDYMDRRIRRYIRAKQKLIKLLEEQKQAIIHRAVTRGLDPNVRLKPSGVEWLGDVPKHWELMRVKQVARVLRGKFTHRPRNDPSLYDGQYPFIQTGEVARAGKSITGFRQTLNERGLAVSKVFPAGTLVMTIAANIGDVAILDFEACFPDSVVGFVPSARVERDFLYYMFVAMKPELLREAPVNTQGNLNVDRIGARAFAVPPLPEQSAVVRAIESDCASLIETIAKAQREISLLREYRTRLIGDVVTGKLDVREAAARLPDEGDEPDLLDVAEAESDTDEPADDLDAAAEEAAT